MAGPHDLAWAAGLLEGEGCFGLYDDASGGIRLALICTSTDLDVLSTLQMVFGAGTIGARSEPEPNCKQAYDWRVWDARVVSRIAASVRPYMHSRRRASIDAMLAASGWHESPTLLEAASQPVVYCACFGRTAEGRS